MDLRTTLHNEVVSEQTSTDGAASSLEMGSKNRQGLRNPLWGKG